MITIVDYGVGNLGSIRNMLKRIGVPAEITGDLDRIAGAAKLILPGVGAFDRAMARINEGRLREVLDDHQALTQCQRITLRDSLKSARLHLWDEAKQRLVSFSEARATPSCPASL